MNKNRIEGLGSQLGGVEVLQRVRANREELRYSAAGDCARPGRSGWRPRQPPSGVVEVIHHSVTARAPRPPGGGAGWQRPGRARSPA